MFEMLKKFFAFCNEENRRKFYIAVALGVLDGICGAMKIPASYFAIRAVLKGNIETADFVTVFGLMLVSTVGKMIINRYSQMLQTEGGYNTCALKRIEIGEHLRYLPMGYFNDTSLGNITSVTTNTLEQMSDIATRAIIMILQGVFTTVIVMCGIFIFDARIGFIALIGAAVFFLVNQMTNRKVAAVADEKIEADQDIVGVVLEYIQGIAEIRNYDLVDRNNQRLSNALERKKNADISAEMAAIPAVGLQMLVCKLTGTAICGAALSFCLNQTMGLPETIVMLMSSFILFEALDSAGVYTALLRIIGKGVDRVNAILDLKPMDIDGADIEPASHDISLDHVSFSYDTRKIINDVTLDIREGTTIAIVGPSGSGKTTLASLMARFWDVQEGKVTLGNRDVREYSFDSLMKNFSFVFQRVYLFEDTVANNIRFSHPDAGMEEVIEAAKKARCHDFIMQLPDGYDTVLQEGGSSLSGGEKQRIAIARAMLKNAPVIILDEATANVDPENEKELTEAVENLTKEKTIIMIAHRLKTVRKADQIIVIDQGKIVQRGRHEDLIREKGIYADFVKDRRQAVSWKIS